MGCLVCSRRGCGCWRVLWANSGLCTGCTGLGSGRGDRVGSRSALRFEPSMVLAQVLRGSHRKPSGRQLRHPATQGRMQRRARRQPERAGAAKDGQADQQAPEPGVAGTTGEDHRLRGKGRRLQPGGERVKHLHGRNLCQHKGFSVLKVFLVRLNHFGHPG